MKMQQEQAIVIWSDGHSTQVNMGSLEYYRRRFDLIYAGSEDSNRTLVRTHWFKEIP